MNEKTLGLGAPTIQGSLSGHMGSIPNYQLMISGIKASRESVQGDQGAHQLVNRMSNQEQLTSIVVDDRASQRQVAQEKTYGKSKRRDSSLDAMTTVDEKLTRMRNMMLEFIEKLNKVKGRINEVEGTLCHEFTNFVNCTTAPLYAKAKAL